MTESLRYQDQKEEIGFDLRTSQHIDSLPLTKDSNISHLLGADFTPLPLCMGVALSCFDSSFLLALKLRQVSPISPLPSQGVPSCTSLAQCLT